MALISEDDVRKLAAFKGTEAPVTSCYLDVDGRRFVGHHTYHRQLERLVRRCAAEHRGEASVQADLRRIEEVVKGGVNRKGVRGIALFSCEAHGFWQEIHLAVSVPSQIVVNHAPYVRPLEAVIDEYERFAVVLVDRHQAKLYVFEQGELLDRSQVVAVDRKEADGRGAYWKTHQQQSADEQVRHHLRAVADALFSFYKDHPFDRLILGADAEVAKELEHVLHPWLRERVAERVHIPLNASEEQVRRVAHQVEESVERRGEAALVAKVREQVGAGRLAVAGLDPTLRALSEKRVEHLLVSAGYEVSGWRCPSCDGLARLGRGCPWCGAAMNEVDDVVDEAVAEALGQHCRVEICVGNADLDVLGRIAALLRY